MNDNNNGPFIETKVLSFPGVMNKVYGWMFIGLLLTAATAWYVATNENILYFMLGSSMFWVLIIAQFVLVWILSARAMKMSYMSAAFWFLIYSVLTGVMFSSIFIVFDLGSIFQVFLLTAGIFGVMSLYGFITKKDLTGLGMISIFGLIGIIVATLLNMFIFKSSGFDLVLTYIGIVIFLALIAYDTQKIKNIYQSVPSNNVAIIGALTLYLDFINLFIRLLNLLGKNRD